MLLGDNFDNFEDTRVGMALFVIFMFLVVILLANVLIAIVTDSYKVIQVSSCSNGFHSQCSPRIRSRSQFGIIFMLQQDQKAAVVFWTNRLDFVAEMDAIANGPFWRLCGFKKTEAHLESTRSQAIFGREPWKQLMDLYMDEVEDDMMSFDFWVYTLMRVLGAMLIPVWLLVGLITCGTFQTLFWRNSRSNIFKANLTFSNK